MILTIDEIRMKIRPICEQYKIEKVWLFGSYARGEARVDSDMITRIPTEYPIFAKYIERDKVLLYDADIERRADSTDHRAVL